MQLCSSLLIHTQGCSLFALFPHPETFPFSSFATLNLSHHFPFLSSSLICFPSHYYQFSPVVFKALFVVPQTSPPRWGPASFALWIRINSIDGSFLPSFLSLPPVIFSIFLHPSLILCTSLQWSQLPRFPQISYCADRPDSIIADCLIIPGHWLVTIGKRTGLDNKKTCASLFISP